MKDTGALWREILARLRGDERGFTLIEVMVAITIIFAALATLAYAATTGFTYESLARQKQTATGIADQIMEQARGLAWDKITAGHLSTDLAGDPNLTTGCAGDAAGVYRFLSCTAGSTPGSGEKAVASAAACPVGTPDCVSPLVRHTGTITQNSIQFTWRTYDTNNCPTVTTTGCTAATPYRVTAIVTWTGGSPAPNKIVQVQSLFWSPSGCRSTATHPFAAPCQPFFFGTATIPRGDITISGTVQGTTFQGDLFTSGVQSSMQQEQLSQAQGSFTQSGVSIVDGSGTQTAGGTVANTSAADTDPGTLASTWSGVGCPTNVSCSGNAISSSLGSGNTITLTEPSGETAQSDSTTAAGGTNVCPPPTDAAQTDGKPCGGSRIQQANPLTAVLALNGTTPALGSTALARVDAPSAANKTFVDRVQNNQSPAGLVCVPVTNSDGCVEEWANRAVGNVSVGGLPSALSAPTGWSASYFSVSSYADSATAAAGTDIVPPTTTPQVSPPSVPPPSGTVSCWNGSSGYNTAAASSATPVTCGNLDLTQTVSGHFVEVKISATSVSARAITRNPTAAGTILTSVTAQVTPPSATITYQIFIDTVLVTDLTITVNLGVLDVEGSYAVAPGAGS
jgi:prepilin-type N-terminal cleavage/methylation domain-containing protein